MVRHRVLRAVWVAILAGAGIAAIPTASRATEVVVLGDSIGQGIAMANGLHNIARRSFSLRRSNIAKQIAQMPKDAIGVMSLGINDAADPVWQLAKGIEAVVHAIEQSGRKVVWVGPPCVLKTWDTHAEDLDIYLRERLATTAIQYVSLRDDAICAPTLRSRDGHHFTQEGYKYVWTKIRRGSSLVASASAPVGRCAREAAMAARRDRKSGVACVREAAAHQR